MTTYSYSVDGFGERDDIARENDRMLENRPPNGYTRWEDYHAAEAAKIDNFRLQDNAKEQFEESVQALIQSSLGDGRCSLSVWADQYPGADTTDAICEKVSILEGLNIQWENVAQEGGDKVDLIFWWE